MPHVWEGTHLFLWQANQVLGGDPNALVAKAKELGLTGVLIKFANGSLANDYVSQAYMNQFLSLVQPFKSAGFTVGGWIYQYLLDVQGEVDACAQAIEAGADWIVLDAEIEIQGKEQEVQQFGQLFRGRYPNYPLGLSSFAIANYHPEVPFSDYNQFVDVMLPQIYWHEMGWDVSVAFYSSLASYQPFNKPIAPTGESTSGTSPQDMNQFVQLVQSNGLTGLSWWDWQDATDAQLQAIKDNIILPPSTIANDVREQDPFSNAIQYVLAQGILHVDVQGNFHPEQTVTRGMLAQVIYNMDHRSTTNSSQLSTVNPTSSPIANDVQEGDPFSAAIQYVLNKGILHVDALGNFNPNQTVTRGMLAQVIYNMDHLASNASLSSTTTENSSSPIANDVQQGDPFSQAIQYVLSKGILHVDTLGNYYPNQAVTRGMLSQVIYNIDHLNT